MYHPQLAKHSPPRPMISYLSLQRSASPRLRNINQALNYPSRRHSTLPRSLNFFSRHASYSTSLNLKLTHPSSPTKTLSMPQMQQYNGLNESDIMEGPLNRLKRSWSEWDQEIGVSCLMKGKPLRGRKLTLTLSPRSRGRKY